MSTTIQDTTTRPGPLDPVGTDLTRTLKALKLGQMTQTLPERLALARQRKMGHAVRIPRERGGIGYKESHA